MERQTEQKATIATQDAAKRKWLSRPLADVRNAADQGDAAAQFVLGQCFLRGEKGCVKSAETAVRWWTLSAKAGNALAMSDLGHQHNTGEGTAADAVEAARLFLRAAQQGLPIGMCKYAQSCLAGYGREQNVVAAALWLRRSAHLGFAEAQRRLAGHYMRGTCGLPTIYKEAARLARLAAAQSDDEALFMLGEHSEEGWGCVKSSDAALTFFRQAATRGNTNTLGSIRKLAEAGHRGADAYLLKSKNRKKIDAVCPRAPVFAASPRDGGSLIHPHPWPCLLQRQTGSV